MKHGGIKAVILVVLVCMVGFPATADEVTVDLNSIVLESFNGDTAHEWFDGRRTRNFEFSWALRASRFASTTTDADGVEVTFPIMTYVNAWPIGLYGQNPEGREIRSLGINGRFDRQGFNWIDIFPVQADGTTSFEIPIPGRVRSMDVWVWGSNHNFTMDAYVRDDQGIVHILPMGSLAYTGWRNLRTNIPNSIRQTRRTQPSFAQLNFVKFRIWTEPTERVSNFFVYLNQLKILTDTFESFFDGGDLADPDLLPELWANTGNNPGATN
jgi:hypothetical protein